MELSIHVGYDFDGVYSFYIQGGPAVVMPDGLGQELELAGKFGGICRCKRKPSVYGELSGITGDEFSVGTKIGMKYSF